MSFTTDYLIAIQPEPRRQNLWYSWSVPLCSRGTAQPYNIPVRLQIPRGRMCLVGANHIPYKPVPQGHRKCWLGILPTLGRQDWQKEEQLQCKERRCSKGLEHLKKWQMSERCSPAGDMYLWIADVVIVIKGGNVDEAIRWDHRWETGDYPFCRHLTNTVLDAVTSS